MAPPPQSRRIARLLRVLTSALDPTGEVPETASVASAVRPTLQGPPSRGPFAFPEHRMAYTDQVATAESGGNATAKNPRSSATGLGQFIDSTWLDQVAKYRPDLAGLPEGQILALRNDPDISREMIQHYGDENGAKLRAVGLPDTDGTRYLAHFAGPGGARAVLSADPTTPVVQVLQPGQVSANPFVRPMT